MPLWPLRGLVLAALLARSSVGVDLGVSIGAHRQLPWSDSLQQRRASAVAVAAASQASLLASGSEAVPGLDPLKQQPSWEAASSSAASSRGGGGDFGGPLARQQLQAQPGLMRKAAFEAPEASMLAMAQRAVARHAGEARQRLFESGALAGLSDTAGRSSRSDWFELNEDEDEDDEPDRKWKRNDWWKKKWLKDDAETEKKPRAQDDPFADETPEEEALAHEQEELEMPSEDEVPHARSLAASEDLPVQEHALEIQEKLMAVEEVEEKAKREMGLTDGEEAEGDASSLDPEARLEAASPRRAEEDKSAAEWTAIGVISGIVAAICLCAGLCGFLGFLTLSGKKRDVDDWAEVWASPGGAAGAPAT